MKKTYLPQLLSAPEGGWRLIYAPRHECFMTFHVFNFTLPTEVSRPMSAQPKENNLDR